MRHDGYYGWVPILTLIIVAIILVCVLFNLNVD